MSILNAVIKFIPKKLLNPSIPSALLSNELIQYITDTVDKLLRIRDSYSNMGDVSPTINSAINDILSRSGILSFSPSRNEMINRAYLNLNKIAFANAKDEDIKSVILYQIGLINKEREKLKTKNIVTDLKETTFNKINRNYLFDLQQKDEDGEWVKSYYSQGSKLEITYLLYGENEVRELLKADGYSNKSINFIIPNIINNAVKNKVKYKDYLDQFQQGQSLIREINSKIGISPRNRYK